MDKRRSLVFSCAVYIQLITILICTTSSKSEDGRWCFECAGVSNPAECGHVRKCETDQECFSEKYDTSMAFPKYNSGCEDQSVCQRYSKREYFIHQVGDITICKSCCNDTDGCNGDICHAAQLNKRGTLCFNCKAADSPETCQTVTMCLNKEVCAWTKRTSVFYNKPVYQMGCLSEPACNQMNNTHCCSGNFCNAVENFDCGNGQPVPRFKMCDGVEDCPLGTDEKQSCTQGTTVVG